MAAAPSAWSAALAGTVAGFATFSLAEAASARIHAATGLPVLAMGPPVDLPVADHLAAGVRPAVHDADQAAALRAAGPVLCVDTGMQRFACPAEQVDAVLAAGGCGEAFTHATRPEHVARLLAAAGGRGLRLHAAATALLDQPDAWLDGVRPGLALYRDAVRVAVRLVEGRDTRGPAGYTGFAASRHGVIPMGYSNGLRTGWCQVAGVRRRVLEVGMQTAFVELGPDDRRGDEVVLLGDGLTLEDQAQAWGTSRQEVLWRLLQMATREYREAGEPARHGSRIGRTAGIREDRGRRSAPESARYPGVNAERPSGPHPRHHGSHRQGCRVPRIRPHRHIPPAAPSSPRLIMAAAVRSIWVRNIARWASGMREAATASRMQRSHSRAAAGSIGKGRCRARSRGCPRHGE